MYPILFLFWILLNQKVTAEILAFGIVLIIVLAFLGKALFSYGIKEDIHNLKKLPPFFKYLFILFKAVISACMAMIKIILDPSFKPDPAEISFSSGLKTRFGNFLLANSITLTPGTITVHQNGNDFTVHCLHHDMFYIDHFLKAISALEEER